MISLLLLLAVSEGTVLELGTPYESKINAYETQIIKHVSDGGLKRFFYFQCAGSADFTMLSESDNIIIESYKDFVSKESGDCGDAESSYYSCFADPCNVTKCAAYPAADCNSNYCNGCSAEYSVAGTPVDCAETELSPVRVSVMKGAPPHMLILMLSNDTYAVNLQGKRSPLDSTNSYQLYLFNNSRYNRERHVMLLDAEVSLKMKNSTAIVSWKAPDNSEHILKHYCLYYEARGLGETLNGDWLACGLEVKSYAEPFTCTNSTQATIADLAPNKSHYLWIVAVSTADVPTAYPYVRVDIELSSAWSRTLPLSLSLNLFLILLLYSGV